VPSAAALAVFAVATFVLTATPGPGVIYVVGRAVSAGRRAGLASMLGIETGEAVYIAGAALGLTALLATSATALSVLRFAGAGYLILLGIRALRQVDEGPAVEQERGGHWGAFGRGLVVQLLNPKVAVFFVAYFPQFIRPGQPVAPQVLVLGAIYLAIAVITDSSYVLLAAWLTDRLGPRLRRRRAQVSAITYFALAAAALLIGDRATAAKAVAH